MGGLFGLTVSTAFICLTSLIAWWARKLTDKLCPKPNLKKVLLQEAIATWELCAACFELIIVADNYGVCTYAVFLFVLTVWWTRQWQEATACPYSPVEEAMEGRQQVSVVLLRVLAQLAGGALTYRYSQYLWSLEVSANHRGRAYEACVADLQVPALLGAIIEGAGTCLYRVVSRGIAEVDLPFGTYLDAFFATSLVVAAFNYSGGYFNPALATALKLGCEGNTGLQHLTTYWVGPMLGAAYSVLLYNRPTMQGFIRQLRGKQA